MSDRNRRPIAALLSAMAVGWTGARLLTIALPWFVLTTTDSVAATGFVVFAQMGPYVVAQLAAGPLIDKIGARTISIAGDVVAATFLALIPVLHMASALPIPVLMLAVAIVGAADGPANTAKSVLVPAASKVAGMRLERATGLSGAIERSASTVGPAVAGGVVAAVGGVNALWITAGLTTVGGIIIAFLMPNLVAEPDHEERDATYWQRQKSGLRFLNEDKLLRSIVVMIAGTNLLDQAFVAVLLPVWAKTSGHGPGSVGLLLAVFSAAAVAASLAAAAWGHKLPRRLTYLAGFVIGGVPRFAVLAFGAPMWLVLAVLAVGGLGSGFLNPIIGAIKYERVPAAKLGRVSTLTQAVAWSGIPFGGLVGGLAVMLAGLSGGMIAIGGLYFLVTLVPGLRPEWKEMDRQHGPESNPSHSDPDATQHETELATGPEERVVGAER